MDGLRWTGSDRWPIDAADADDLAKEVAMEIHRDQYDGYKCANQYLAMAIAWYLASYTKRTSWRIHNDIQGDAEPEYRIWVQR